MSAKLYLISCNGQFVPASITQLRAIAKFPFRVCSAETSAVYVVTCFKNGRYLCTNGEKLDPNEVGWTLVA